MQIQDNKISTTSEDNHGFAPTGEGKVWGYQEEGGAPIKAWVDGVAMEAEAAQQLKNIARLPFVRSHIAVMPDVHYGIGATVGTVFASRGAIVPAAVGVDIGCGMVAHRLNFKADELPDNLGRLRSEIERVVPHGRTAAVTDRGGRDKGSWGNVQVFDNPSPAIRKEAERLKVWLDKILAKHPKLRRYADTATWRHMGTLGTGNHFIELCVDEEQRVWVMLHSGSRGIGGQIGNYFIEKAKEKMQRFFIHLPDKDLAYIPEGDEDYNEYVNAVKWAQDYAALNRTVMMHAVLAAIHRTLGLPIDSDMEAINCHHNYISEERHFGENVVVTRKGAVHAGKDVLGIIPGSMGAKSYIVRGKGNRESYCSCSHGAGREMSRHEARRLFKLEDHIKATEGVECRKDIDVIDETPLAYKPIDSVMAAQEDLVEIVHTLKQVLCVKG